MRKDPNQQPLPDTEESAQNPSESRANGQTGAGHTWAEYPPQLGPCTHYFPSGEQGQAALGVRGREVQRYSNWLPWEKGCHPAA